MTVDDTATFDPYMTAIIHNRIQGIVREMTNTLLRAARSTVINTARDFSCSICTADNQLLAVGEGLPIHIFGSGLLTEAMGKFHAESLAEGDCFLHNDPYNGNSHAADHAFLTPVFVDGEHLFTAVAKAHQADIGNSVPTTYMATAQDQYQEGALIFPAVRIQSKYETNQDIVRMCEARIRAPRQWYGDFLAGIGATRIAERRLKELCAKYGVETIKRFIKDWLNYSENRMINAIRELPEASLHNNGAHDPIADVLPDGIEINIKINVKPEDATIELDLLDNADNMPCGLNVSEACVVSACFAGVFNVLDPSIPRNSGSIRRLRISLRDGSICGRPKFPHSCSVATTNVSDRLVNMTHSAFAQLGEGHGLAEGGVGMGAGGGVISGYDTRGAETPYINQLIVAGAGGPGAPSADGWPTWALPVNAGLMYRDSIEVEEFKHPMLFDYLRIVPGSAGAGKFRGSPATELSYGPTAGDMEVHWPCDGTVHAPKGILGGLDGCTARHFRLLQSGKAEELPNVVAVTLGVGERVSGYSTSGGGYGDPKERDPKKVLKDVLEGYETVERAKEVYGVAFTGDVAGETLAIDKGATAALRT
ncbi:hydantoinase B/oxoprolinase family protein [Ruegeria sp. 2012CJ41-6]|uniref:Hydantoinase B/oxoprolinase family protein n=1 Tax=Ruegeria spongiae TaxID=2942209 RepID=A0ABT0Q7D8_9RHOB|nr:hydantoinase B/oxoprolinase family protein [Ruegeria spongiae]MCL6285073.1 hydantoinase B/oxoprolinase family protein [Ruegeria spongiae]